MSIFIICPHGVSPVLSSSTGLGWGRSVPGNQSNQSGTLCRIMASFALPASSDQCPAQIKSTTIPVIGDQGYNSPLCYVCLPWSSLLEHSFSSQSTLLFQFNYLENSICIGTREANPVPFAIRKCKSKLSSHSQAGHTNQTFSVIELKLQLSNPSSGCHALAT